MLKRVGLWVTAAVLITDLLTGCESKADRQADELYKKGEVYFTQGKLEQAIQTYEQVLKLKESSLVSDRLKEAEAEKKAVDLVRSFQDELGTISAHINSVSSSDEIMELLEPIRSITTELDLYETNKDTEIAGFIKELQSNPEYQLFTKDYVSGATIRPLIYEDAIIVNSKIFRVKIIVDDLRELELPKKYTT
ncbi:tetratricopeptide repeat protein [Paenibacillus sp. J22TS3]|uniref:tetratricopeptide repeat protein n=1 Tax=Paenibacillus sp. J22TS3 TaxID=2807192 RepID=UPI001B12A5B1|nr:tetratricopeptide repeat protein [Paenibacillus sp. J22TS3]GIP22605.1 hypothetical protein J22TS3_28800 [Paenibacillus sp. J22TS3]